MSSAPISKTEIQAVVDAADAMARERADLSDRHPKWPAVVTFLRQPNCPRTYLPFLCIMLIGRALRPSCDTMRILVGEDKDGYAPVSIGQRLIPLVVERGIDLRTTSTSVLNSQTFRGPARVTPDLSKKAEYPFFYSAAQHVAQMEPGDAVEVLALVFAMSRRDAPGESASVPFTSQGLRAWEGATLMLARFVASHSDNGRVGQALGAALLDAALPGEAVTVGQIHDPGFNLPGDFHAGNPPWLFGEAKQKPVHVGTVMAFVEAVRAVGGRRALYLALSNADPAALAGAQAHAREHDVQLLLAVGPHEAVTMLMALAPRRLDEGMSRLLTALVWRMEQMGAKDATVRAFRAVFGALDL